MKLLAAAERPPVDATGYYPGVPTNASRFVSQDDVKRKEIMTTGRNTDPGGQVALVFLPYAVGAERVSPSPSGSGMIPSVLLIRSPGLACRLGRHRPASRDQRTRLAPRLEETGREFPPGPRYPLEAGGPGWDSRWRLRRKSRFRIYGPDSA